MGLGIFDRLYTLANEEISEVQAVLRNFSKTNYDEQLANVEISINELSDDLKEKRKEYKTIEKDVNTLQRDILKLNKKIKPIDETVTDINLLQLPKSRPFKPFEQLLMVLPQESKHLLPSNLGSKMVDINSDIIHYYPIYV